MPAKDRNTQLAAALEPTMPEVYEWVFRCPRCGSETKVGAEADHGMPVPCWNHRDRPAAIMDRVQKPVDFEDRAVGLPLFERWTPQRVTTILTFPPTAREPGWRVLIRANDALDSRLSFGEGPTEWAARLAAWADMLDLRA